MACGNRDILIAYGVSGANLGTLGIESDCKRATLSGFFSFASMVDDALVILHGEVRKCQHQAIYLVASMTEVHTNNVHSCSTQLADHFNAVSFWA